MSKSREVSSFYDNTCLTIDVRKVRPVSLEYYGADVKKPQSLYRPLTRDEKKEVIYLSLRHCTGFGQVLRWAFKSLILWLKNKVYTEQAETSVCASTSVGDDTLVSVAQNKVRAVSLEYFGPEGGKPQILYRPLTKKEKWVVICLSLRYGSMGILNWAFSSLIFWWTKNSYPQQGLFNMPHSNVTTTDGPST